MSHAKAAKVLPDYDTFSENKTIRDMIAPVETSYYHQETKAYLILINKSIYDLLCINKVVYLPRLICIGAHISHKRWICSAISHSKTHHS